MALTLAELRKDACWIWLICNRCMHRRPFALAPFIIRYGGNTSSNLFRNNGRCGRCGKKGGVTIQGPSWAGTEIGFQPFPVEGMRLVGSRRDDGLRS
jgi:hypothetical protein